MKTNPILSPPHFEVANGDFLVSTDPNRLDFEFIHQYLAAESYWSQGISIEVVQKAAQGSLCFAIYHEHRQIAYARVISDGATYGYIADVFVRKTYQGQGLGQWLMTCIFNHPQLQGFRRWSLATQDAHGLYEKFGFTALQKPDVYMEKVNFRKYV